MVSHREGWLSHMCIKPGHQAARAAKFCTMAPTILGSSVWNVLHITLLAHTKSCQLSVVWRLSHGSIMFVFGTAHLIIFLSTTKVHGWGMWRVWGRGEGCTGFWWRNLRERDHWGDPDADGRIILRWIFRKWEGVVGTGWSWLRIGTGGGHLWVRWWTLGFENCGEFQD